MAKVGTQTKIQLCVKMQRFGENRHFRSSVIFTPKVRMEHGDRRWKTYPTENNGEPPEFE